MVAARPQLRLTCRHHLADGMGVVPVQTAVAATTADVTDDLSAAAGGGQGIEWSDATGDHVEDPAVSVGEAFPAIDSRPYLLGFGRLCVYLPDDVGECRRPLAGSHVDIVPRSGVLLASFRRDRRRMPMLTAPGVLTSSRAGAVITTEL